MSPTKVLLRQLTITVAAAALAVGPIALGQETRPAARGVDQTLQIDVWTCPDHEQFRLAEKGACPVCERQLVRTKAKIGNGNLYPLETCPVSGLRLGEMGQPVVMLHEGREVRFCCAGCVAKFEADAESYLEQIDKKIIAQQLPYYPLTTCPVSGEPLGSMGEPVNHVHNNRLVRFCCKGCRRMFRKAPAEHLAVLDEAVLAAQMEAYPLEACPISGLELGSMDKPVDYVAANRLVRFCCGGCVAGFYKSPAAHLAKLEKAWQESDRAKP